MATAVYVRGTRPFVLAPGNTFNGHLRIQICNDKSENHQHKQVTKMNNTYEVNHG